MIFLYFGTNALEVTAFHVPKDVNNAWAISGIRMGAVNDPFLRSSLSDDQLPFVGHSTPMSDHEIVEDEKAFEAARKARLLQYFQAQAVLAASDASM